LVLALIARIDNPADSRKRRISRIFRIAILFAGMASPQKAREGTKMLKNNALENIPVECER
jgi:hypothetical protein